MAETLAEKARRLGIQPGGAAPVATTTPQETLSQKAARLGIAPAAKPQAAPQQSTLGKVAKGFDAVFGGGKVGEYIGTKVGYALASDDEKKYYDQSTPTGKEILGSALKSASVLGGAAITGGTSVVGQALAGAGAGYAYDVGSDLEQNKSAKEILTPGLGTVIGAAAPVAIRGAAIAGKPAIAAVARGAKSALPTTEKLVSKRVKNFDTIFQSSGSPRNFYTRSGNKGYSVSETLANNDRYIPNVNGGKITPESAAEAINNIQKDAAARAQIVDEVIKSENKYVNVADWKNAAIKELESIKLTGNKYKLAVEKVEKDFEAYAEMADPQGRVPLKLINDTKQAKYNNINFSDPDSSFVDRAVARGSKKMVEDNITDVDIKDLNYELGRLYDAKEGVVTLAKAGATVPGGRLGRMAARGIGVVLGSSGGPVSSILAGVTADQLAVLMQKNFLKGNPVFNAMIDEIAEKEPAIFEAAKRTAERNKVQFLLPEPKSNYRSEVSSGAPVSNIPAGRNIDPVGLKNVSQSTPALPRGLQNKQDWKDYLSSSQADTTPATTNAPTSPNTNTIPSTVSPPAGPSSTLPPGQAFAGLPAGFETDENGEIKFNPVTAGLGAIGVAGSTKANNLRLAREKHKSIGIMLARSDNPESRKLYMKLLESLGKYIDKNGG